MNSEYNLKLADDLKRLCCAETEGKFFDCVTDNIDTIVAALRASAAPEDGIKLTYVKRWRTIVPLPAKYADEIVEALRALSINGDK